VTDDIAAILLAYSFNYMGMVIMSCKSGFTDTTVTTQCIDVNKWSHKPPICTSKIVLIY
jgi:hypothetical protein